MDHRDWMSGGRPYPDPSGRPLRGLPRFRFLMRLWANGYPSVRRLQSRHDVAVDGLVGPQTWATVERLVDLRS